MIIQHTIKLATAIAATLFSLSVHANCGTAVCAVNTNWSAQGGRGQPGPKFDLRYEFINQDQPRAGTKNVAVGALPRHEDEVRTINRNWFAAVDYAFDEAWGINAAIPIYDRGHRHIKNEDGTQEVEDWNFTEIGDLRLVGRYQFPHKAFSNYTIGLNFGLKLPTGKTDVANAEADVAERTLQPGTGTTDLLLGGYYSWTATGSENTWFAQAMLQAPLSSHDNFKPGQQLSIDFGVRRPWTERASVMLQLNASVKRRNNGSEADPRDSGSRMLAVSPGFSYALGRRAEVYAFVQMPIYQYVNGIQLTADWAAMVGVSSQF